MIQLSGDGELIKQYRDDILRYAALHLSAFEDDLAEVTLVLNQIKSSIEGEVLYQCVINVTKASGLVLDISNKRASVQSVLDDSFARLKRSLLRNTKTGRLI